MDWYEDTSMHEIKDSGRRQEFPSGSQRDDPSGKGRYDLLFRDFGTAVRRLALHVEAGGLKYGDDNWLKGQPLSRYLGSALRHLAAAAHGREDEDHLAAALWNVACLLETLEHARSGRLPGSLIDLPYGAPPELDR